MEFNDKLVESKMGELLDVKYGLFYITGESVEKVTEILGLDNKAPNELIAVRNSVVKAMSGKYEMITAMSAIVCVIDSKLPYEYR